MYGRLGYQVASYCVTLVHGSTHLPVYNAMAMYRNYDGNGGRFGAYSIGAASPNKGVNVYAAADSPTNPTKLSVMLVNVSGANQRGLSITLKNFTPTGAAQVYRMTGGGCSRSGHLRHDHERDHLGILAGGQRRGPPRHVQVAAPATSPKRPTRSSLMVSHELDWTA